MGASGFEELNEFNSPCPNEAAMREVILGCAPRRHAQQVLDHLKRCQSCAQRFDRIETELLDAPWIGQLNSPVSPYSQESSAHQVGDRVREVERSYVEESSEPGLNSSSSSDPFSNLPKKIGEYSLVTLIGQGGMGLIFKAQHLKLNKPVAVKALRHDLLIDVKQLFEHEIRALASIDHPLITRATDAFEAEDRTYLVMEYVDGWNLAQVVGRYGPLLEEDAILLVRQIALGMDFAHLQGVVHGDLKPSNVMLSRDGGVKILDLGLARTLRQELPAGEASGETTEQKTGAKTDDHDSGNVQTDLVGLSVTFFRLLTGRLPVAELSPIEADNGESMIAELIRYRPNVSLEIQQIYASLRSHDDSQRFINMLGVVEAIDRLPLSDIDDAREPEADSVHEVAIALQRFRTRVRESRLIGSGTRSVPPPVPSDQPSKYYDDEPALLVKHLSSRWGQVGVVLMIVALVVILQVIAYLVDDRHRPPGAAPSLAELAPPERSEPSAAPAENEVLGAEDPWTFQNSNLPLSSFEHVETIEAEGGEVLDLQWTLTEPSQLMIRSDDMVRSYPLGPAGERIDLSLTPSSLSFTNASEVNDARAFAIKAYSPWETKSDAFAINPTTGEFATSVDSRRLVRVDWKSFQQQRGLQDLDAFEAICFVPKLNGWMIGDQGQLKLYDPSMSRVIASLALGLPVHHLTCSLDGKWVIAELGPTHTPSLIEISEPALVLHSLPRNAPVQKLATSFWHGPIQHWDSDLSEDASTPRQIVPLNETPIVSLVFLVGRRMLVFHALDDEGEWKWVDWESEIGGRVSNQLEHLPYQASISEADNYAVLSTSSGSVECWDLAEQRPVGRFRNPFRRVSRLSLDPTQTRIAVASEDGTVAIYGRFDPVDGSALTPGLGDNTPVQSETMSVRGENRTVQGENTPVHGANTAVRGDNTAVRGDNTAVRGDNTVKYWDPNQR